MPVISLEVQKWIFWGVLQISPNSSKLPPPPPHNLCLASPRPCPGYVQNKPAGKSKNSIQQIQNFFHWNSKCQQSITTTSAERIEGSFGRNPSQVRLEISAASGWRDTGVAEKSFSAGWLRCCCYFPPIRQTMKPWLVSHVIKTPGLHIRC